MTHEEGVLCRPRGVIRFCIIYHVHRRYRRSSCPIEGVKYHIPVPEKEGVPSTFSQIPLLAVLMSPLTKMTLSYLGLRRDTGSGSTWATWALQFSLQFRRMSKIQPERNATRPMCIGDLCERGKGKPGTKGIFKGSTRAPGPHLSRYGPPSRYTSLPEGICSDRNERNCEGYRPISHIVALMPRRPTPPSVSTAFRRYNAYDF